MPHKRLFIPGPTEVRSENLAALAQPQIGHRSAEFKALYASVIPKLRKLLGTDGKVFLFTSSSTGVWEAAIRNCVRERVLCCMQGAFSDRWLKVAESNGKQATALKVEWGPGDHGRDDRCRIGQGRLRRDHRGAQRDIHRRDEPSGRDRRGDEEAPRRQLPRRRRVFDGRDQDRRRRTGNRRMPRRSSEGLFAARRSGGRQRLGSRARKSRETIENRGYYFDLLEIAKYDSKGMTPSTPAIPQIQALDAQLDDFFVEGLEARFARHAFLADIVRGGRVRTSRSLPPKVTNRRR